MRPLWIKAAVILAGVWLVATGIRWWAGSMKSTPESVEAYVAKNPLTGRSTEDRTKVIEKTADQVNALPYEDRQKMRMEGKLGDFLKTLTPEEQSRYVELTVPAYFKQMMEALNKKTPAERKKIVDRALRDIREHQPANVSEEDRQKFAQDKNAQKIIDEGLKSFYNDASAETKLDLAPLLEEMQRNIQQIR